jgi:hypothetical protein
MTGCASRNAPEERRGWGRECLSAGMHEQTREASLPRGLSANIAKDVHRMSILDARGGMSPAGPPTSPRDPWSVVTRVAGATCRRLCGWGRSGSVSSEQRSASVVAAPRAVARAASRAAPPGRGARSVRGGVARGTCGVERSAVICACKGGAHSMADARDVRFFGQWRTL